MEMLMNYIKPELIVVAVVLYFIGIGLKKSEYVKDKFIPAVLGVVGIALCLLWVFSTTPITSQQTLAAALFLAIIQGILVAGLSTYVNQLLKQSCKDE